MKTAHDEYVTETGVDPEIFRKPPPVNGLSDEKLRCYSACMLKASDAVS